MKAFACPINTARGGFVDGDALYWALKEGEIAMAAFDVTDPEPPGARSPLLAMGNIIITAHSAFFSADSEAKERYVARWGPMKESGR